MKKRIVSLVLALTFVFASVFTANAAGYRQDGAVKTPTSLDLKDVMRLAKVAHEVRNKDCKIINATKYNGSSTTWIVRLYFGAKGDNQGMNPGEGDQCAADFVLNVYPYGRDAKTQEINTLPFKNFAEGCQQFGHCWYYFGVFDTASIVKPNGTVTGDHNSCGYVVAERLQRWPKWGNLAFTGITERGIGYTGAYPTTCDDFVGEHPNLNGELK